MKNEQFSSSQFRVGIQKRPTFFFKSTCFHSGKALYSSTVIPITFLKSFSVRYSYNIISHHYLVMSPLLHITSFFVTSMPAGFP